MPATPSGRIRADRNLTRPSTWLPACSASRPRRDSRRCTSGSRRTWHSSNCDLRELSAEPFTKGAFAFRRELHRARSRQTAGPSVLHAVLANQRAEHAGKVWPALAPIQTCSAQNAPRMLGPPVQDFADVHSDCSKMCNAGIGDHSGVSGEFDIAVLHKPVGDRYAKLTGQMVVTGPRSPKRSVFGSDRKFSAGWLKLGRHLHDAFKHIRDRWRRQAVVAVTALFFDAQQAGRGHAVEVAARSLR